MSVSERDPDRPIHKDYFLTKDSKNLNTVDRSVKPAKGFFEKPIGFDTSSGPGPSLAWQRYPETLKTLDNPDFKMNFGPKYMEEALKKRALLNKEIVEERHRWSGSEVKSVEVPAGNTDWKLCLPEGSAARTGGCVSIHPYDVSKLPPINIMQEIRTQPNFLTQMPNTKNAFWGDFSYWTTFWPNPWRKQNPPHNVSRMVMNPWDHMLERIFKGISPVVHKACELTGYGQAPEGYNPRVHGPYDPSMYYGSRKGWKPISQVKISELPVWLLRRDWSPNGVMKGFSRGWWRWNFAYSFRPGKGSYAALIQFALSYSFVMAVIEFGRKRHERKQKYHW